MAIGRRRVDLSKGERQCPATTKHGHDGDYLCCQFVACHDGKHKTSYDNGEEWEEDVSFENAKAICAARTQRERFVLEAARLLLKRVKRVPHERGVGYRHLSFFATQLRQLLEATYAMVSQEPSCED